MIVKTAEKSDKNQLIRFFKHYHNNSLVKKRLNYFHTIIVKDKKQIVGVLQWQIKEDPNLGVVEFEEIFIKEKYRNQGFGSMLLTKAFKQVESYFIKHKIKLWQIFLYVNKTNLAAIRLYHKFGFEKVVDLGKFFSEKEDEILMIRKI